MVKVSNSTRDQEYRVGSNESERKERGHEGEKFQRRSS